MISAWFLSDLHLKNPEERSSQTLLRFLRSLSSGERTATHLYLVGDIFDFWVGNHSYYERQFQELIEAIVACRDQGIKVTYFEGNHDVHVKRYWEDRYQIPCFIDEKYDDLDGIVVRVEHGDLINPKDEAYLKYRDFIRKPSSETLAQLIPARLLHWLGDRASQKSRKRSSVKRRQTVEELRQMIRDYAMKSYSSKPFHLIITGHMHIRDEFEFERGGRQIRSVNLGSWFDAPLVFHLTELGHEWVNLSS